MRRLLLAAVLAGCAAPDGVVVAVYPAVPTTDDELLATVDDDRASIVWRRDGLLAGEGQVVDPYVTRKHETWTAQALVGGEVVGEASVEIVNSPPVLTVTLEPDARRGKDLNAEATVEDADDDEVVVAWRWYRDDVLQPDVVGDEVPSVALHAGESWRVEAVADDGEAEVVLSAGPAVVTRPGEVLFAEHYARQVSVKLGLAATAALGNEPTDWVRGDLTWNGTTLKDVGVRLKGRGSFETLDERPSLLIDTDRFVPGQLIDGLDEIALHNAHSDPSLVRERVAYKVLRELGVPAPRAVHVGLLLNDLLRGPYTLVEVVDGRFLDEAFGDGSGPLFEMPGVELNTLGVKSLDHDGGPDDRTRLLELADLLADPLASLSGRGADLIDVDAWARYLAACGLVGHYDGYPFNAPGDDLYLYVDPLDDRIRFVAHGADEALQDPLRPVNYLAGDLGQRCLREVPCREAFVAEVWSQLERLEALDLEPWLDEVERQIELLDRADWRLDHDFSGAPAAQAEVRAFLDQRREALETMIVLQ